METRLRASWSTITAALGLSVLARKRDVSLPITARQMNVLKALHREDPDLGELAIAIAQAFDATRVENPELAALILDKTCRRMVTVKPAIRLFRS